MEDHAVHKVGYDERLPHCPCPRLVGGHAAFALDELGVVFVKGVGDVFEKDEAEEDVLVVRCIHVVAHPVGSVPEFGHEADGGGRLRGAVVELAGCFAGHEGIFLFKPGMNPMARGSAI